MAITATAILPYSYHLTRVQTTIFVKTFTNRVICTYGCLLSSYLYNLLHIRDEPYCPKKTFQLEPIDDTQVISTPHLTTHIVSLNVPF